MNTLAPQTVRFPVADVTPTTDRFPETTLRTVCEEMICARLLACPAAEQPVVKYGNYHSLIAATALAYQFHFPLALSPDMIWLTVVQGVAQHIKNHAEKLQARLVHHQTRIELVAGLPEMPTNEAAMLAAGRSFAAQIARHVRPDKQGLFQAEFTTTTDNERIVGHIVLMDAYEPFFDYVCGCICGIPSVILEGTPEDWELLGAKVQALHDSDLELDWWTQHLLPLCEHFVRASRGDVDRGHWNNLCKLTKRYNANDLNGWMLKFIPYVGKENLPREHRNPVLSLTDFEDHEDMQKKKTGLFGGSITGCVPEMLPSGISQVPVTLQNRATGGTMRVAFIGGFLGVRQSESDLSLRPVIGWGISEGRLMDQLIARLQLKDEAAAKKELEAGRSVWTAADRELADGYPDAEWMAEVDESGDRRSQLYAHFDGYAPADIIHFYLETDGAEYLTPKRQHLKIFRIKDVRRAWKRNVIQAELDELLRLGHISEAIHSERLEFNRRYSKLCCFANDSSGNFYLFGRDPEENQCSNPPIPSRGEVFRWDRSSGRSPSSFTPVAMTFSQWLKDFLDAAEGNASF